MMGAQGLMGNVVPMVFCITLWLKMTLLTQKRLKHLTAMFTPIARCIFTPFSLKRGIRTEGWVVGLTLGRHKHLMELLCFDRSSAESDIEGMEVIGEDGENLEDEDMETLDEAEREEEEDKMEEAAERAGSPEEGTNYTETQKPSQQQSGDRNLSGLSR